ncbi:arginine deiminase [Mycoplasmatota bacterium]|nr:arginine deiminase [Mycoplasmatota bacterium]
MTNIKVTSEIGKLKTVLVHKPGDELLHLTPEWLIDLLFDDIPWLKKAREEHQIFQDILKEQGVLVLELVDLVVESLSTKKIQKAFFEEFLDESDVIDIETRRKILTFLSKFTLHQAISKTMAGILKTDLMAYKKTHLKDYIDDYPFYTDPMPNLYFTRDPFTIIDNSMSIHAMFKGARKRETLYAKYIYTYHPSFKHLNQVYERTASFSLEGGDILNLNHKVVLVGMSERTEPDAVEILAKNIFDQTSYKKVLAVLLPKKRTYMHLDTIFTQVDFDKFVIHPDFLSKLKIYEIISDETKKSRISIKETYTTLKLSLKKHLQQDIHMIACGGKNAMSADREQWNDGANVFAISPGVVIAYERNDLTNKKLEQNGIKVIRIPSSELSRGRGGPRCMTMPLLRDI